MGLSHVRFPIWRLMVVVALAACATGSVVTFSAGPNTAGGVPTWWGTLYGVPLLLILARGIPAGRAARVAGRVVLRDLPVAGLLGLTMSGDVGLIGGLGLAALVLGWGALLAAALFGDEAVPPAS